MVLTQAIFNPEEILISNIIADKSYIYCVKSMIKQFSKREKNYTVNHEANYATEDQKILKSDSFGSYDWNLMTKQLN